MNELGLVSSLAGRSFISTKTLVYSVESEQSCAVTALCFTVCLLPGPLDPENKVCSPGGSWSRLLRRGS